MGGTAKEDGLLGVTKKVTYWELSLWRERVASPNHEDIERSSRGRATWTPDPLIDVDPKLSVVAGAGDSQHVGLGAVQNSLSLKSTSCKWHGVEGMSNAKERTLTNTVYLANVFGSFAKGSAKGSNTRCNLPNAWHSWWLTWTSAWPYNLQRLRLSLVMRLKYTNGLCNFVFHNDGQQNPMYLGVSG